MKRRAFASIKEEILSVESDYENNFINFEELENKKEEILNKSGWTLDIYEIEVENQARRDDRYIYNKIK